MQHGQHPDSLFISRIRTYACNTTPYRDTISPGNSVETEICLEHLGDGEGEVPVRHREQFPLLFAQESEFFRCAKFPGASTG